MEMSETLRTEVHVQRASYTKPTKDSRAAMEPGRLPGNGVGRRAAGRKEEPPGDTVNMPLKTQTGLLNLCFITCKL